MKKTLLLPALLLLLPLSAARAQTTPLYFPPLTGNAWATTTPASLGWCQPPLDNELWTKIMALFCRPTATAAAAEAAGFLAFPNPAAETLTLRQPARAAATVCLLDALGREVLRQPVTGVETSVSVAALTSGLYNAQWLDINGRILMSRKVAH